MPIKLNKVTLSVLRRIACFLLLGVMGTQTLQAQVSTTVTMSAVPIAGSPFSSLAGAITAINALTITGPVIATAAAGSETNPAGGYSITATGTSTNTITIQGASVGTTTITAPSPAGTAGNLNDAIFKIIGGDYITIKSFTMNENSANTTTTAASNNMVEWGVALLYATTTNGAQNCTIQNNTITLNRTYQNTFGIYSNSTHSATSITTAATATTAAGGNSSLKMYGNTISNVNLGIVIVGPTAAADANTGIEVGGTNLGNTISNFGTTGTFSGYLNVSGTVNGILLRNCNGFIVSNNSITSSAGGVTVGTLNGIQIQASSATPTTTFTNNINSNTISLQSGVAAGAINGINYSSGAASATSILNINNNNFTQLNHSVVASGTIIGIVVASTNLTTSISNNTFTNLTTNTTGSFTFISQTYTAPANGSKTTNGNSIVTAFAKTGVGGTVMFITDNGSTPSTCTSFCQNNNFSNGTLSGATALTGLNYTDGGTAPTRTVSGNTINNWTTGAAAINCMNFAYWQGASSLTNNTVSNITGQGSITGITIGATVSTGTTVSIANNTINNLSSTGTGGAVTGISCTNTSTQININNNAIRTLSSTGAFAVSGLSIGAATSTSVYKNSICDISGSNATSAVNGILVSSGTTINISNNRIADLRTPAANAANPLVGLNITGGTTVNAYYNTIYLNGSSSGALFGSSALSVSTSPTLTLNNNSFHNASTSNGTGLTVAYRRSSTTLTTYGSTSDRNNFMASTLYFDGVTSITTLGPGVGSYKAFMAPRDQNAISVTPPYLSTTCGDGNFLKMNLTTPTQIESGGAPITGITDDFEGDTRNASTPDIGADEFAGTPAPVCNGTPATASILGTSSICSGSGISLSLSTTYTDLGITYQWASSTTSGGPYTTTLGTSSSQSTGALTATTYYVCTITCTNSGLSTTTSQFTVTVNPLPTVGVTPASASYCTPGGTAVTLTASGANTYSWSPSSGLSATTGSTVSATPASTTNYTVIGTDGNGCTNTSVTSIAVSSYPLDVSATATPSTICTGGTSSLAATGSIPGSANAYNFNTSSGASLDPMAGATTIVSASTDDAPMNTSVGANTTAGASVALPFSFNFNGNVYTHYSASPDGWIMLGTSTASAASQFSNAITSTTNIPKIYPVWDDFATGTDGWVKAVTTGTSPNRVFKVEWKVTIPRNTTGASNSSFQCWMYETANKIEFRYGTMGVIGTSNSGASSGLTASATNFQSISFGTNTVSTVTANDANSVSPASGRMYTFTLPSTGLTYSWDPSASVVSSNTASTTTSSLSSSQIYTVTVTNNGCSTTSSATVTINPLTCNPATFTSPTCAGSNFTVTANTSGGGAPYTYVWNDGVGGTYANAASVPVNLPAGTYTLTCNVSDACGSNCTSSVVVTVNPNPTVTASASSTVYCTPGTGVNLTAGGASTYSWTPSAGLNASTGSGVTATPSSATTYTVVGTDANGCTAASTTSITVANAITNLTSSASPNPICSGNTLNLSSSASLTGLNNYVPTLSTGVSYSSIIPATTITSWRNGNSTDDNLSDNQPIGFNFNYNGTPFSTFRVSTNGFITFDNSSTATGNGSAAYGFSNNWTLSSSGLIVAPNWDDLQTAGNLTSLTDLNNSINYTTTGSTGSRVLTVEWKNMQDFSSTSTASYNFQVKLYESDNHIEFVYGTMTQSATSVSYSLGLSAATVSTTPTASQLLSQTTSNTNAFGFSNQNSLTPVPTANTQVSFYPATLAYNWSGPSAYSSGSQNPSIANIATSASGVYTVTATSNVGCSATSSVAVTVNATTTGTTTATACDSYTWSGALGNGNTYTSSTSVSNVTTNAAGCPHTETLNLTVNSSTSGTTNATACNSYTWMAPLGNGTTYTSSTTASNVSTNAAGCPHTETLNLTVNYSNTGSSNHTACNMTTVDGVTYTTSGSHTHTYMNAAGCDSVHTYNVTINYSSTGSSAHTACNMTTVDGVTYTTSGSHTHTYLNAAGCDSVHTYNVTIRYSNTGSSNHTACNSTTVDGVSYTTSGSHTHTYTNAAGCDSVHTYNVTINYSNTGSSSHTACNMTSVDGVTYTASGSHTHTYTNAAGCDSVHTYNVTIRYSNTGSSNYTACDMTTVDGVTYTASGSHTHTYTNAAGCDSVHTYNVTINYSTSGTTSATACDSYTWSCNGQTYTQSGTYTCTYTNAAGCLHTQTLNLTVNYSTSSSMSATACDSYTWACNGQTYMQSGNYICTYTNAVGCPHTKTLNLTINYSTSSTVNATACDSYTWGCNGQTYNQSGVYTCTYTNAAGCLHTATLNLTINYSTSNTTTILGACGSYTWSINGHTYTQSGTYTVMSTNAAGCPHASILVLTVIPSVPTTVSQTQCGGSYTWPCNGQTYTQSGTYTCGSGCYQVTLNLTINAIPVVTAQNVSGCPGTAITLVGSPSGGTYSLPNPYTGTIPTYTYYYTTPQGCTNSATATITLNTSLGNVTNLSISGITSTSANASWGGSGVWFDIRYKPTSSSIWTNGASGSSFSKLITGLTASTIYSVEVRGYCIQGSTPTNWVGTTFTTTSGVACATPVPTTTTNIAKTSCKLNWTHPGASYYNVRYKKTSVSTWTSVGTTSSISKLLSGLTANTQYEFQVQAVCTNTYSSAWSTSGFFTTLAAKMGEEELPELTTDFNIYPNPTQDELNVIFGVEQNSSVVLKLVDMSGRTVRLVQMDAIEGRNHMMLSLGDLTNGVYSIQVINNDQLIHTTRVIKN